VAEGAVRALAFARARAHALDARASAELGEAVVVDAAGGRGGAEAARAAAAEAEEGDALGVGRAVILADVPEGAGWEEGCERGREEGGEGGEGGGGQR